MIDEHNIDILCMQETEVYNNLDESLLGINGFFLEMETNDKKKRTGIYINSNIKYTRRKDLESIGLHLVILDVSATKNFRLINMYRTFNPPNNITPKDFFYLQMAQIKAAYTVNTILLGDFNLDWTKKGDEAYSNKHYFEHFDDVMEEHVCIQLVKIPTWSRMVNNQHRESTIDHVYVNNKHLIRKVSSIKPYFGDHLMIIIEYDSAKPNSETNFKRNWKNYSKTNLCHLLSEMDWNLEGDQVQDYWNNFESKLVEVVDQIIPFTEYINNTTIKTKIPPSIKKMMNIRKRLLKKFKTTKLPDI